MTPDTHHDAPDKGTPGDREPMAVLHVALTPYTGAWSVMRELAAAQSKDGRYAAVALGVIADRRWPGAYREEAAALGLQLYETRAPAVFGTAQFLWQAIRRPGIERWVRDVQARSGARCIVVHFHNAWMSGVFLPLRCPDVRLRTVATFHGVNADLDGKPVRHAAHRWMAGRLVNADAVLTSVDAVNPGRANVLFRVPEDRFTVIPNGSPPAAARGCPFARGAAHFTVGHVGSITEQKGWRIAVDAVRMLAARGLPVRLLIAGTGAEADAAAAAARETPETVTYLGHVANPRDRVVPELDLLAVMSVREGLPMTIIEALAGGVPVAATCVGGIPEAVREGVSGYLVPRNADALAAVITELCASPERLAALSTSATDVFNTNFAMRHILDRYDTCYRA